METLATKPENGTYKLVINAKLNPKELLVVISDGEHDFGFVMPKDEKDLEFYFKQVRELFNGQTSTSPTNL